MQIEDPVVKQAKYLGKRGWGSLFKPLTFDMGTSTDPTGPPEPIQNNVNSQETTGTKETRHSSTERSVKQLFTTNTIDILESLQHRLGPKELEKRIRALYVDILDPTLLLSESPDDARLSPSN